MQESGAGSLPPLRTSNTLSARSLPTSATERYRSRTLESSRKRRESFVTLTAPSWRYLPVSAISRRPRDRSPCETDRARPWSPAELTGSNAFALEQAHLRATDISRIVFPTSAAVASYRTVSGSELSPDVRNAYVANPGVQPIAPKSDGEGYESTHNHPFLFPTKKQRAVVSQTDLSLFVRNNLRRRTNRSSSDNSRRRGNRAEALAQHRSAPERTRPKTRARPAEQATVRYAATHRTRPARKSNRTANDGLRDDRRTRVRIENTTTTKHFCCFSRKRFTKR